MYDSRFHRFRSLSTLCEKMASFLIFISRCFAGETREVLPAGKRLRYVHDRAATRERRRMLGR
jgi:hypothetical protein